MKQVWTKSAPVSYKSTLAFAGSLLFGSIIVLHIAFRNAALSGLNTSSSSAAPHPQPLAAPPRGYFGPILWDQGVSHDEFHLLETKNRVLNLVRKYKRVAIVGVSGGADVISFAGNGIEVHAFEPLSSSINSVRKWAKNVNILHNIHLYHVAATKTSTGHMMAAYRTGGGPKTEKEYVKNARVADYLPSGTKPLDLLSVDVQGGEWEVLQGADLRNVRSLWVEVMACNKNAHEMISTLDKLGYAMFDMVPVGATTKTKIREPLLQAPGAAGTRPSNHSEYLDWMCSTMKKDWLWLQTDILAIRRDLITPKIILQLKTLSAVTLIEISAKKKA